MVSILGAWLAEMAFLAVWIYVIGLYFLSGALRNPDLKSLRRYYVGFFVFFVLVGTCGVIHFTYEYYKYVVGREVWAGLMGQAQNPYFYVLVTLLQLGFAVLSYQIEKYVRQSKYFPFTVLLSACFAVSLVPYFLTPAQNDAFSIYVVNASLTGFLVSLIYWGVFYLRLAKLSTGIVRRRALAAAFGLAYLFFGILMDVVFRTQLPVPPETNLLPSVLILVVSVIGVPLVFFGFQRKLD
ncbi:MAG: hypothetical protein Kow0069_14950 [Promethearchaeota archaeon]